MGFYAKHIFSRALDWSLGSLLIERERGEALAQVRGRVLEIGFGTGLNLRHYPRQVTALTAIDSERALKGRVAKRIEESHMPVEQIQLDASGRLPLEDDSFDSVVTTFTLCSIADVASALLEARRVIKPDGRYVFLEHGRSDDARVARRQDLFNPIQRIVACGCNINRPIDRIIQDAGFAITKLDRYLLPDTPRILGHMYRGSARKQ